MSWRQSLSNGQVIPACPLALNDAGTWSTRHQAALLRYYAAAGAGGLAVGVHSTQFAIRHPEHALLRPLLEFTADVLDSTVGPDSPFVRIAGVCGQLERALSEAQLARDFRYDAALLSLTAVQQQPHEDILEHARRVSEVIPIVGFYLQPAVGGRILGYRFWRELCDIPDLVAIKVAPFNRYFTNDVVRAVIDSGRAEVALYTGNDDNIIGDLLTPFEFSGHTRFIAGGLLGQWGIGTRAAVDLLEKIKRGRRAPTIDAAWNTLNAQLTDLNSAVFDAANSFAGCIPGINELLRRQSLTPSARCLDPDETLSKGQTAELDRVTAAYPHFLDDEFVREHVDDWLR